jgi:hypothetical protein
MKRRKSLKEKVMPKRQQVRYISTYLANRGIPVSTTQLEDYIDFRDGASSNEKFLWIVTLGKI